MTIDLNSDVGEHPTNDLDEQIMCYISSCNIACGGHIGDEDSVRKTIKLANHHQVAIGAHPSYPDREYFGRKNMEITASDLIQSLTKQIQLVKQICEEEHVRLHHLKLHGALYNQAAKDRKLSELVLQVIKELIPDVPWMGLPNSCTQKVAKASHYPFISEGFADRKYLSDGNLMSRSLMGAVLFDKEDIIRQVEGMVLNHQVKADHWYPLKVQSICLHGDTKDAVILLKEIKQYLESKGILIAKV